VALLLLYRNWRCFGSELIIGGSAATAARRGAEMEMRAEAGEYAACAGVKAREARRGMGWDGAGDNAWKAGCVRDFELVTGLGDMAALAEGCGADMRICGYADMRICAMCACEYGHFS
jgi:hypothetical protein